MAGIKRSLSASSELTGDPSQAKVLSKRPIRRSAGSKTLWDGFVNTDEALRTMLEEESASDDELWESSNQKHKRVTKAKRRLSPTRDLSPTPPIQDLPLQDDEDEGLEEDESNALEETKPHTLSLKFYVPRGHVGPFVVNLDLSSLTNSYNLSQGTESTRSITSGSFDSVSKTSSLSSDPSTRSSSSGKTGFMDLPAELRNEIYKYVLLTKNDEVSIRTASNFCRSSALLATCRQIHDEGTQVLYGAGTFILDRQWHSRAPYYGKTWEEVAYKDCFRFLKTIGPRNVSLIHKLRILGEDGPRSGRTSEALRFVNDEYLIQCLKLLARHGQLQHLELHFQGKRKLKFTDHRFLNHIFAVKADTVVFGVSRLTRSNRTLVDYDAPPNIQEDLDGIIKERCERKIKLFPTSGKRSHGSAPSSSTKLQVR